VCRIEFSYKAHRPSGRIRPRCSEHAMEYEYSPKACGRCGEFYIPASGMSRYCSDECFRDQRNARARERTAPRPLVSSWCENCGILFQSKTGARFCTASCRSTFDRRKKGKYELGSHRRRAESYGCEYDETVTRVAILVRDKWTCGICGDPIPQDVAYPSREYGSLDHIIPMSKQGGHTQENTQAAHLGCNMRKHASMPEEMPTAEL
jgi:5-methylcytosine-specific restriction endonuclease McrA